MSIIIKSGHKAHCSLGGESERSKAQWTSRGSKPTPSQDWKAFTRPFCYSRDSTCTAIKMIGRTVAIYLLMVMMSAVNAYPGELQSITATRTIGAHMSARHLWYTSVAHRCHARSMATSTLKLHHMSWTLGSCSRSGVATGARVQTQSSMTRAAADSADATRTTHAFIVSCRAHAPVCRVCRWTKNPAGQQGFYLLWGSCCSHQQG